MKTDKPKEVFHKWFRRDNLIIMVLVGVLLFIISLPTKSSDKSDIVLPETNSKIQGTVTTDSTGNKEQEYVALLEEKLKENLSKVSGVGRVEVMITLKASEELVLEKDESLNRTNTNEEDSEGGKRIMTQLQTGETTVYHSAGNESRPYVIKTLQPVVEGVLVVAQGADSGNVNRMVTEIVKALFGVDAHKVRVVKMEAGR